MTGAVETEAVDPVARSHFAWNRIGAGVQRDGSVEAGVGVDDRRQIGKKLLHRAQRLERGRIVQWCEAAGVVEGLEYVSAGESGSGDAITAMHDSMGDGIESETVVSESVED